jgi:hypothetical protein
MMASTTSKTTVLHAHACICFWCGAATGAIIALPDDASPHPVIVDYTPCAACRAQWNAGIVLVEVTHEASDNRPALAAGAYPTGRWAVVAEEGLRKAGVPGDAVVEHIIAERRALVWAEEWAVMGLPSAQLPAVLVDDADGALVGFPSNAPTC